MTTISQPQCDRRRLILPEKFTDVAADGVLHEPEDITIIKAYGLNNGRGLQLKAEGRN